MDGQNNIDLTFCKTSKLATVEHNATSALTRQRAVKYRDFGKRRGLMKF